MANVNSMITPVCPSIKGFPGASLEGSYMAPAGALNRDSNILKFQFSRFNLVIFYLQNLFCKVNDVFERNSVPGT
jgi:hypothetical protein